MNHGVATGTYNTTYRLHPPRRSFVGCRAELRDTPSALRQYPRKPPIHAVDHNDNVFYVYYIGRYDDEALYHYGTTTDLLSVELAFQKRGISKYIKCRYEVIDTHVCFKERFDDHVARLGVGRILSKPKNDDVLEDCFALANDCPFSYITGVVDDTFLHHRYA